MNMKYKQIFDDRKFNFKIKFHHLFYIYFLKSNWSFFKKTPI